LDSSFLFNLCGGYFWERNLVVIGILSASSSILRRKVARLIGTGPRINEIIKGLQIMGLKQKMYSNSFQVVVTPLDVIVVAKILHEPNVTIDVCRHNVVAKSNHE
jgi:hypothetical protein